MRYGQEVVCDNCDEPIQTQQDMWIYGTTRVRFFEDHIRISLDDWNEIKQLDIPYCQAALKHYFDILKDVELKFKNETGLDFVKGTSVFEEVFVSEKDKWEKTEKGNWRWDASLLETFENPVASLAIQWSEAKKQSEYFANFLYYCDRNGVLHPDFQQSGTVTGRLSCRDPNLQNLTNPDKYDEETEASLYPVRRAFIPRDGFFFAMPDYSQVEFRILLDIAMANSMINEVLKGHDVHTATAIVSGTTRKEAKTTNFLTAYGGGAEEITLQPGEWITLAAKAVTGTPSYVTGYINTREDQ